MALRLITEGEFRASRYGQLADQIEGRLSTLIEQAESYIESRVDRTLSRKDYVETPEVGRTTLFLSHTPVIEVRELKVNGQPISNTTFTLDRESGMILLDEAQRSGSRFVVTYAAGYDPVPPVLKAATILQTAYYAYQDFEIYGSGDGKPPGITYMQDEINTMIAPFKRKSLV